MPLVPDTARWACLYNTRGAKARSGWAESGSALNAPWCEEIRGDVRGWPWAYLLPSVALLLLSGFTTPTLGGRGGSDGLARPPAAEKPPLCKNSIQTLLFYDSILWQLFSGIPLQMESDDREKCVALCIRPSHILISECR